MEGTKFITAKDYVALLVIDVAKPAGCIGPHTGEVAEQYAAMGIKFSTVQWMNRTRDQLVDKGYIVLCDCVDVPRMRYRYRLTDLGKSVLRRAMEAC